MPLLPEIENLKVETSTTILVYFSNGIVKIFDLKPFLAEAGKQDPDIKLGPDGILVDNKTTISGYDLWSGGKFYGTNRLKL